MRIARLQGIFGVASLLLSTGGLNAQSTTHSYGDNPSISAPYTGPAYASKSVTFRLLEGAQTAPRPIGGLLAGPFQAAALHRSVQPLMLEQANSQGVIGYLIAVAVEVIFVGIVIVPYCAYEVEQGVYSSVEQCLNLLFCGACYSGN
jgi:hypothetical protein